MIEIDCRLLPDSIASSQTDPLRDGAILFLRFGELLLCPEGFVGLVWVRISICGGRRVQGGFGLTGIVMGYDAFGVMRNVGVGVCRAM